MACLGVGVGGGEGGAGGAGGREEGEGGGYLPGAAHVNPLSMLIPVLKGIKHPC